MSEAEQILKRWRDGYDDECGKGILDGRNVYSGPDVCVMGSEEYMTFWQAVCLTYLGGCEDSAPLDGFEFNGVSVIPSYGQRHGMHFGWHSRTGCQKHRINSDEGGL